jgi:hypothetical protein
MSENPQVSGFKFVSADSPKGTRRLPPSAIATGCFAPLHNAIYALPALRQVSPSS